MMIGAFFSKSPNDKHTLFDSPNNTHTHTFVWVIKVSSDCYILNLNIVIIKIALHFCSQSDCIILSKVHIQRKPSKSRHNFAK